MEAIKLPVRALPIKRIIVSGDENILGPAMKVVLRGIAKGDPSYHYPIELDHPVSGKDDAGNLIPINTIGKWLFGVPGYKGNAIFEGFEKEAYVVKIPNISEEATIIIHNMLIHAYSSFKDNAQKNPI